MTQPEIPEWKVGPLRIPEPPSIRDQVSMAMLAATEGMEPLFDSADDVRSQMRRRGYSDHAAEAAAMCFLQNGINHLWGLSRG